MGAGKHNSAWRDHISEIIQPPKTKIQDSALKCTKDRSQPLLPVAKWTCTHRWKWADSDSCWRCKKGRQIWGHPFKGCGEWKRKSTLCGKRWEIFPGKGAGGSESEWESEANPPKNRKSFGHDVRKAKRRPSNVTNRDLLGNWIFTGAVLEGLGNPGVETIKEGMVLDKG